MRRRKAACQGRFCLGSWVKPAGLGSKSRHASTTGHGNPLSGRDCFKVETWHTTFKKKQNRRLPPQTVSTDLSRQSWILLLLHLKGLFKSSIEGPRGLRRVERTCVPRGASTTGPAKEACEAHN